MSCISSLIRKQVLEENKKIGFTLSQDPGKGKVTRLHTMISKNVRTSQNFLESDFKDHGAQPPLITVRTQVVRELGHLLLAKETHLLTSDERLFVVPLLIPAKAPVTVKGHQVRRREKKKSCSSLNFTC